MKFDSFLYLFFFLPCVTCFTYLTPVRWRWIPLLAGSYFFYAYWNWYYGILMLVSTIITYMTGLGLQFTPDSNKKKAIFIIGLLSDLSILFYFKYFSFLVNSINSFFSRLHSIDPLEILLPVGISFYVLQSLSYTIDVYRGRYAAEKHFGYYALYICFFPQLVAGPIERYNHLSPQLSTRIDFPRLENFVGGCKMIIWGLFKKMIIADRLAFISNPVFHSPQDYSSIINCLAVLAYMVQIYADFSGYCDIAFGSAKFFNIDLSVNFNKHFLANSMRDYWKRWHITLGSWLREYLFVPLGGNKKSRFAFASFMVFLICGIWHGAKINFVLFGIYIGLIVLYQDWVRRRLPTIKKRSLALHKVITNNSVKIIAMYPVLFIGFIFFRGESWFSIKQMLYRVSHYSYFKSFNKLGIKNIDIYFGLLISALFLLIVLEYFNDEDKRRQLHIFDIQALRWLFYLYLIFILILFQSPPQSDNFIYFQF